MRSRWTGAAVALALAGGTVALMGDRLPPGSLALLSVFLGAVLARLGRAPGDAGPRGPRRT